MWLCINSLWHTENTWPMFYLTTHLAVWDRQILCYWWVKIFTIILKLCVFSYWDQKAEESWTLHRKGNCFMLKFARWVSPNYANPVNGVVTIRHQVRWLRWGHPSLFHIATSLLIWYKMFCVRDISYRLIWMEFINMFFVYAQSGTHSRFDW